MFEAQGYPEYRAPASYSPGPTKSWNRSCHRRVVPTGALSIETRGLASLDMDHWMQSAGKLGGTKACSGFVKVLPRWALFDAACGNAA